MGVVGHFVLGFTRELARMYVTASMASWILDKKYRNALTKEGTMRRVFDAQTLNLSHLNPAKVSYDPQDIHTEAIQVTPENIGKLSLEFMEELFYDDLNGGRPYFVFSAKRFDAEEPNEQVMPTELTVRLTDWIVPLWDELHVFRDVIFQHTFTFDFEGGGQHSKGVVALARPYVDGPPLGLNTPMSVPAVNFEHKFQPNDRVYVKGSKDYGIVTVVDVEIKVGDHSVAGVEVKHDSGHYVEHTPNELEFIPDPFHPNMGHVEGPTGTGILPRVDE